MENLNLTKFTTLIDPYVYETIDGWTYALHILIGKSYLCVEGYDLYPKSKYYKTEEETLKAALTTIKKLQDNSNKAINKIEITNTIRRAKVTPYKSKETKDEG
jgi:hypothetical protein